MAKPLFAEEPDLDADSFIALLADSGLGERRPIDDKARIDRMLRGASLIVTARVDGALVGVSRSITDFAYCCYLSDLAVAKDRQGQGIGKALIAETQRRAGPEAMCLLLSAPDADLSTNASACRAGTTPSCIHASAEGPISARSGGTVGRSCG